MQLTRSHHELSDANISDSVTVDGD